MRIVHNLRWWLLESALWSYHLVHPLQVGTCCMLCFCMYVIVKVPPRMCMENIGPRVCVERLIQHEVKLSAAPECCIFTHKNIGGTWSVILYFILVLLGAFILSAWTTSIFQTISKCSYNLYLVVEKTGKISLGNFSDCNVTHIIICLHIRTILPKFLHNSSNSAGIWIIWYYVENTVHAGILILPC